MIGSFDRLGFRRHSASFVGGDIDVDLTGKRAIVTGANSGIGYAAAEGLLARGAEVQLLCRDRAKGAAACARLESAHPSARVSVAELDVSDLGAVRAFCASTHAPLDVLIHNAGVLPGARRLTRDGLEETFATHVAGPHLLTAGLAPALRRGARVIFVTSGGMYLAQLSLDDLDWSRRRYDGTAAYAQTKRMQTVLAEVWAERLRAAGVSVYAMHPGWADTPGVSVSLPLFHKLTRPILRSAEQGADTILWLAARIAAPTPSGGLFFDREARRAHYVPWTQEAPGTRQALVAQLDSLRDEK